MNGIPILTDDAEQLVAIDAEVLGRALIRGLRWWGPNSPDDEAADMRSALRQLANRGLFEHDHEEHDRYPFCWLCGLTMVDGPADLIPGDPHERLDWLFGKITETAAMLGVDLEASAARLDTPEKIRRALDEAKRVTR